jgi:hypothetical protein
MHYLTQGMKEVARKWNFPRGLINGTSPRRMGDLKQAPFAYVAACNLQHRWKPLSAYLPDRGLHAASA